MGNVTILSNISRGNDVSTHSDFKIWPHFDDLTFMRIKNADWNPGRHEVLDTCLESCLP